jgi:hypothetical protein
VNTLHREVVNALQNPDVRSRLSGLGLEPVGNTPAEFAAIVKETSSAGRRHQARQHPRAIAPSHRVSAILILPFKGGPEEGMGLNLISLACRSA